MEQHRGKGSRRRYLRGQGGREELKTGSRRKETGGRKEEEMMQVRGGKAGEGSE